MDIENILTELGLTKAEILTYKALLNYGELNVADIAQRADIERTLVYYTTERLIELGLVSEFEKNKKKHFKITNPDNLKSLVDQLDRKTQELKSGFKKILPFLNKKYISRTGRPFIDVYTGISGLEKVYDLILDEASELKIFAASSARDDSRVDTLIRGQIKRQEEKGIGVKSIVKDLGPEEESTGLLKNTSLVEIGILPHKEFQSNTQVFIWKNTVALNTRDEEMITTIIRSENFYRTMNMVFNALWKRINHPSIVDKK